MNELASEWVEKADADFYTAGRELAVQQKPNYDAVCFHCQQCIEKLMKAVLLSGRTPPPRTHDLVFLDGLVRATLPEWSWSTEELRFLTRAAVSFRYPGESADREDAEESFRIATGLRTRLLEAMRPSTR